MWSTSNPPVRPGNYLNWRSKPTAVILPSAAGTLFVPYTDNWGPFKTVVRYDSYQDFVAIRGSDQTPAQIAVKNAFKGEGIEGYPGAGRVLGYRTGSASAAKARKTLQNETPANAIELIAKYEGTKGNRFSVTVQTNAIDNTIKDLLLYEDSTLLEKYEGIDPDDMAALAALINERSGWITAAVRTDRDVLANVTNSVFADGNDGDTLTNQDWTDILSLAGTQEFAVFAPYDLTDSTIQAAVKAWVQDQNNNKGRRFSSVLGGLTNEPIITALRRSSAMNDENILNFGMGSYIDTEEEGWPTLSSAQLAPRIAGILAARGPNADLTYARFRGVEFAPGAGSTPDESAIIQALSGGLLIMGSDSHQFSELRLEKGLTTYTTRNDQNKQYAAFSVPKFVMTMQEFERILKRFAIERVITPSLAVNRDTREFIVAFARALLRSWEGAVIKAGTWSVDVSQNPPPTDTDDFINLDYVWTFARTAQQVRGTAYVL